MEIERKYLLDKIPFNLDNFPFTYIQQAYISTTPVIRIRSKKSPKDSLTKYILTIKSSGLLERQEYELSLTREEYESLLSKVSGNVITKKRYLIPLEEGLTLELDIFEGDFDGLVMGEIEFESREASEKYNPPEYLSGEVTFDTRFHNSTMSKMSKSEISDLIDFAHTN